MIRQEEILYSLDKLGFATRSQIQTLHDLGSTRNANRILKDMSKYLNSFRVTENIYYLNKEGLDFLGLDKQPLNKNMQIEHHLMKNDMYIYFGLPDDWETERPIHFVLKLN